MYSVVHGFFAALGKKTLKENNKKPEVPELFDSSKEKRVAFGRVPSFKIIRFLVKTFREIFSVLILTFENVSKNVK